MGARIGALCLLTVALMSAGCGGGDGDKHQAQIKRAQGSLHRVFGGMETCSDAGRGAASCRVVALRDGAPVMKCTVRRNLQFDCGGVIHATKAEIAFLRRHAPHATSIIHVRSVARLTVPRSVVASGQGTASAPFRFPRAFGERSRLHGRGPSLYLSINRDHYEDDLVTNTGNDGRQRIYDANGTLLSDYAYTPYRQDAWDAFTRIRAKSRDTVPSFFNGPADPLGVFEQQRRDGQLHRAGAHRYVDRKSTWTVDSRGIPTRFQTRNGQAKIDIHFTRLEVLPITPELMRQLRLGHHPYSRVVHTVL
jgi:hypothetical protein